jgi:hypothetical protein
MSVARRRVADSLETAPRERELKVGQIGAAGTDCLGNDRSPRDNIILMSAKKAFTGCRPAIAKSGWVSLPRHKSIFDSVEIAGREARQKFRWLPRT